MIGGVVGNVLNIARKEFSDLVNNRYILVVLALYFFMVAYAVYDVHNGSPGSSPDESLFGLATSHYYMAIDFYGVLIGIVIGFMAVSSELRGNALNTLIVKPVYRDTIINGKFIGALGYLVCLFIMATMLYLSLLLVFFGASFGSIIPEFVMGTIPLFVASLAYVLIFFFLSMLLSIVTKGQSYALILSIFLFEIVDGNILSGIWVILDSLGLADYSNMCNLVAEATPFFINSELTSNILSHPTSIVSIFFPPDANLVKLVLYVVVMIIICYIAFLRSDIS